MMIERYQSQQEQRRPETSGTQEGREYAEARIAGAAQYGVGKAGALAGHVLTRRRSGNVEVPNGMTVPQGGGLSERQRFYRLRKNNAVPGAGHKAGRVLFSEGVGGAEFPAPARSAGVPSDARGAGRDLVVERFARDRRRAREAGRSGTQMISPNSAGSTGATKTGADASRQTGQTARTADAAAKSAHTARTGRAAVKQGRTAVKAGSKPVKTVNTAANAARKAQKSARTAKIAALRAAKAAKQSAKAAKTTAKFTARVGSSVVRGLVFILSGGLGFLLPVLLIIALVAAIASSPFGIFFSGQDSGPDVKLLSQIVTETNAELDAEIEQIKCDRAGVDEIILTYDGSETNTAINNWPDVVSVFAVKTALADGDAATDVVTLDNPRQARLKSTFWDMTQIDSWVEEQPRTRPIDNGDGTTTDETYPYYILHITVTSLDYREGAVLYNFTDGQMIVLEDMMAPDNVSFMLELLGTSGMGYTLSLAEIAALRARLAGLTLDRQSLVTAALTLEGRVSYFWGGKSTAIGWDNRWGAPMEVTAAGSSTTGTVRPFGLDCSGFVVWSFAQLGVSPEIVGWGTGAQWAASVPISWSEAQPGDLAFFAVPGTTRINHVGIVASIDAAGVVLVVHCNSSRNNVSVTEARGTGFKYIRRPVTWE